MWLLLTFVCKNKRELLWTGNFISTQNDFAVTCISLWTKLCSWLEWVVKWVSQTSNYFIVTSISLLEIDKELIFRFTLAARDGDVSLLNELLDDGVPVDSVDIFDDTALKGVARINKTDVIQVLLERGADLDKQTGVYRRTALHQAAEYNSTTSLKYYWSMVLLPKSRIVTVTHHSIWHVRKTTKQRLVCWNGIKSKFLINHF